MNKEVTLGNVLSAVLEEATYNIYHKNENFLYGMWQAVFDEDRNDFIHGGSLSVKKDGLNLELDLDAADELLLEMVGQIERSVFKGMEAFSGSMVIFDNDQD